MGEVSSTDRYYGTERTRPAYAWKCPNCAADNMGRVEDGCPACGANRDGKHVGIPKIARRPRVSPPPTSPPVAPSAPELMSLSALVGAAVQVLSVFHPQTQAETDALLALERAVVPYLKTTEFPLVAREDSPRVDAPPPPVYLQDAILDARTILTIAAALDHFAEQILQVQDLPEFLSAEDAQRLAETLRAHLPVDALTGAESSDEGVTHDEQSESDAH